MAHRLSFRFAAGGRIFNPLQRNIDQSTAANLLAEVSSERRHTKIKTTPGSCAPKSLLEMGSILAWDAKVFPTSKPNMWGSNFQEGLVPGGWFRFGRDSGQDWDG